MDDQFQPKLDRGSFLKHFYRHFYHI